MKVALHIGVAEYRKSLLAAAIRAEIVCATYVVVMVMCHQQCVEVAVAVKT
jgi:hypothetical protein